MKKIISVFDMDKTIIKIDCESKLHNFLYKINKIKKKELNKFKFFHNSYKTNNFNSKKHLLYQEKIITKRKLFKCKKKIDEFIKKEIKKKINKTILKEFVKKKKKIISTSSNYFFAKRVIKTLFKVPFISTSKNNNRRKYKKINFGINKFKNLKIWMKKKKISSYKIEFYTDSITDLPLILKSKFKILVNPNNNFLEKVKKLENIRFIFTK